MENFDNANKYTQAAYDKVSSSFNEVRSASIKIRQNKKV